MRLFLSAATVLFLFLGGRLWADGNDRGRRRVGNSNPPNSSPTPSKSNPIWRPSTRRPPLLPLKIKLPLTLEPRLALQRRKKRGEEWPETPLIPPRPRKLGNELPPQQNSQKGGKVESPGARNSQEKERKKTCHAEIQSTTRPAGVMLLCYRGENLCCER